MKTLLVICLLKLAINSLLDDQCSDDLKVSCSDDITKGYTVCDKAAKIGGGPADLDCIKYMTPLEKDCWPCICLIAKE